MVSYEENRRRRIWQGNPSTIISLLLILFEVYLMEKKGNKEARAAMKAEPNEVEGGSAIKLEVL